MVTDTALWLILVAMIGWIVCGCYVTRGQPARQPYDLGQRDSGDQSV
ncbi:MAG TPA: hypothetical protein VGR45_03395 [Stellaceae bacterium]|nr:hypothetical protein [Stellaceae bacterium]